ncbi:hypothetical protein IWX90DRAFT_500218 [Phyllosticta citrichinensis]|uniref:Uncharacterized protein n=1 Tax=Phyllosticta citrichinensis TaxID=1130410 RepID=A0ABR1Y0L8_9PEZI
MRTIVSLSANGLPSDGSSQVVVSGELLIWDLTKPSKMINSAAMLGGCLAIRLKENSGYQLTGNEPDDSKSNDSTKASKSTKSTKSTKSSKAGKEGKDGKDAPRNNNYLVGHTMNALTEKRPQVEAYVHQRGGIDWPETAAHKEYFSLAAEDATRLKLGRAISVLKVIKTFPARFPNSKIGETFDPNSTLDLEDVNRVVCLLGFSNKPRKTVGIGSTGNTAVVIFTDGSDLTTGKRHEVEEALAGMSHTVSSEATIYHSFADEAAFRELNATTRKSLAEGKVPTQDKDDSFLLGKDMASGNAMAT